MNQVKVTCICFFVGCLSVGIAEAQSPVTLTVSNFYSYAISTNFSGLSFGTISLKPSPKGYFFDSSDTQMVKLFQQLGIKYLRIGGTSVDTNNSDYTPATQDVDALFRFANATDVKVIYSVRLENGNPSSEAAMVGYILTNYSQYLDSFAIGNEPDNYGSQDSAITDFPSYLVQWNEYVSTITNLVPNATFSGPDGDSSSKGNSWGTQFASNKAGSGIITAIQFHDYAGGSSANLTIQQIIDDVLSTNWDAVSNPTEYATCGPAVLSLGFPYRFTEANSFYTGGGGGVFGGNNCFATALFSLDFMHWWSLYNCQAVCFHTSMWKYNGVIYPDSGGNYQIYPIGYGIKAFDLGDHGLAAPIGMANPSGLNLVSYAVADATNLYVTIINKEHGTNARNAEVTISAQGYLIANVAVMFLVATNNDPGATNGITLGGASITSTGPWLGQWTELDSLVNGECVVTVPATSVAIVKITPETLSVQKISGKDLQLNWGYGILQSAGNVGGPYMDISNALPPYIIAITNVQQYFRVKEMQ